MSKKVRAPCHLQLCIEKLPSAIQATSYPKVKIMHCTQPGASIVLRLTQRDFQGANKAPHVHQIKGQRLKMSPAVNVSKCSTAHALQKLNSSSNFRNHFLESVFRASCCVLGKRSVAMTAQVLIPFVLLLSFVCLMLPVLDFSFSSVI